MAHLHLYRDFMFRMLSLVLTFEPEDPKDLRIVSPHRSIGMRWELVATRKNKQGGYTWLDVLSYTPRQSLVLYRCLEGVPYKETM